MYAYRYDEETGGILLTDDEAKFSKEPRPVYAQELDALGVDALWPYEKESETPFLWAESNAYFYRGKKLFRLQGGALYQEPELIPETVDGAPTLPFGAPLEKIDVPGTVAKNEAILSFLVQSTLRKIYNVYKKYAKKLDFFHVAFSGGKDSVVLLDLVKRALPKTSFNVLFADTGMEFPDTYDVVARTEEECAREGIPFYRARSHWTPEESWRIFGPPSRVLRWCCSVHKAAPQILKYRIVEKKDYVALEFVGVRAHESAMRSQYEYECYGKKQRGQYSFNAILEWSSAEVWLYIFARNLIVNDAYKKGNSRAGCLFCPMGGGKSDFFQQISYPEEFQRFVDLIRETSVYGDNPRQFKEYITKGGWNARKNGRDLKIAEWRYREETQNDKTTITVLNPTSDWSEWIKTLGEIPFQFNVNPTPDGLSVVFNPKTAKKEPRKLRDFKRVFRKAAYCVGCRVCETNCRSGRLAFVGGKVRIDHCSHCGQCNELIDGCLAFHSLKPLIEENQKMMKSINCFSNHAPRLEWVLEFLDKQDSFWEDGNNSLGPNQISFFKRFLRDSGLIDAKNKTADFASLIVRLGVESEASWGLLLCNLSYNPQVEWYIRNIKIGVETSRSEARDLILNVLGETSGRSNASTNREKANNGVASTIINAFKRFCELPFGTKLNFGSVVESGSGARAQILSLSRGKSTLSDQRVVLYSLYKYAEACGVYQFNIARLLDVAPDASAGIAPSLLFGFDRDELEPTLRGLSANYNDLIDATFTHGLDKISLRKEKSSADVLSLF